MFKSKTAKGVSVQAELSDLIVYALSVAYNIHYKNAFSTYGENIFLMIQTSIVIYGVAAFGNMKLTNFFLIIASISAIIAVCILDLAPEWVYQYNMYSILAMSKLSIILA